MTNRCRCGRYVPALRARWAAAFKTRPRCDDHLRQDEMTARLKREIGK